MSGRGLPNIPAVDAAQKQLEHDARRAEFDRLLKDTPLGFADFQVRELTNREDRYGIYLRKFNLLLAVFAVGNYHLQEVLKNAFDDAFEATQRSAKVSKKRKRKTSTRRRTS